MIVEGPDGSGKSTLIRNLRATSKNYFWIASSSGRPRTVPEIEQALHWLGQALYLKIPIVCDRFPLISESIYGPILRHSSLLSHIPPADHERYEELLKHVDRIIYCRPTILTMRNNLKSEPQLAGVEKNLEHIVGAYDSLMRSLEESSFVFRYDYTKPQDLTLDGLFFGRT